MLVDNPTKFPVTIRPCNNYELEQRAAETRPSLVITTRVPAISRLAPMLLRCFSVVYFSHLKQFLTSSSDACADADTQYIAFVNGAVELGELWAKTKTSPAWPKQYSVPTEARNGPLNTTTAANSCWEKACAVCQGACTPYVGKMYPDTMFDTNRCACV